MYEYVRRQYHALEKFFALGPEVLSAFLLPFPIKVYALVEGNRVGMHSSTSLEPNHMIDTSVEYVVGTHQKYAHVHHDPQQTMQFLATVPVFQEKKAHVLMRLYFAKQIDIGVYMPRGSAVNVPYDKVREGENQ